MPFKDKEKKKQYDKQWHLDNKEHMKQYRLDNREKIKEQYKQWILNNKEYLPQYRLDNKEKKKEYDRQYIIKNREKIRAYQNFKVKTDPVHRFIKNQRNRVWNVLKGRNKSKSTIKLLGCSIEECWNHLEQQFKPGMTRNNYGLWHVDHIIPCASFDFSDPEQQKFCFHYTNLQPLWAIDNIKKGAKLDYEKENTY